jgi:EGF-like domain
MENVNHLMETLLYYVKINFNFIYLIKKMKKKINSLLLLVGLFVTIVTSSCTKNPCDDIVCLNNGTCREGACACPSGFEGPFCENKANDKFIGYWEGFKRINGDKDIPVTMIITPVNGVPNKINIYELDYKGGYLPLIASTDLTKVEIATQNVVPNPKYKYKGNGFVSNNNLSLHVYYEETDSFGVLRNHIFEGQKQLKP